MFDMRMQAVLDLLKDICPTGGYAVVSAQEVSARTRSEDPVSAEEVDKMIRAMDASGLINLRFSEGGEYCLTVLPKGRAWEADGGKIGFFARNRALIITGVCAFAGAAAGAFLAGALC